jgi:hypothetical protein
MDVFKSQNPVLFKALQDFLAGLPNASCEEDILTMALHRLAVTDAEACRWFLRNSSALLPEMNFVEQATELAQAFLQANGFLLKQDFSLEPGGQIILSARAKERLLVGSSTYDRLLLEEFLRICD